ncbi:hypothetical protein ACFO9E_34960 [Streptomyces maoxianensis]|uniref:Helix-turn-helix domain-containing protein n=1 Tax=Streptomyces maoxianensis TaxID=1459942 RepID=A0ABV9GIJ0_9ACTN
MTAAVFGVAAVACGPSPQCPSCGHSNRLDLQVHDPHTTDLAVNSIAAGLPGRSLPLTRDGIRCRRQHLREQEMSLRDIAARLVITTGKKKGQHPSPATIMRMLREHDEQTTAPLAS